MLIIGFAAGRIQAVPANLILVKNISVIGVVWGAQAERDPALIPNQPEPCRIAVLVGVRPAQASGREGFPVG